MPSPCPLAEIARQPGQYLQGVQFSSLSNPELWTVIFIPIRMLSMSFPDIGDNFFSNTCISDAGTVFCPLSGNRCRISATKRTFTDWSGCEQGEAWCLHNTIPLSQEWRRALMDYLFIHGRSGEFMVIIIYTKSSKNFSRNNRFSVVNRRKNG